MLLSESQWDQVVDRLNRGSMIACPMCADGELAVGQWVFELRPFAFGEVGQNGPILPVIPAECKSCGHVVFYNAVTLGVVPMSDSGEVAGSD